MFLAAAPTVVRGDAAASNDPAELIVPTGHGTHFDKIDELQNEIQQKVAALFTAEKAILSLQDQLNAASTQLQANSVALTASDSATKALTSQINDLRHKLHSAEATAEAAAKKETAALTERLQKAEKEEKEGREEVRKMREKIEGLKNALASKEKKEGKVWEEEKNNLQARISTLIEEKEAAAATVEVEKVKAAAAVSKAKEEAAAAVVQEQKKAAAAVGKSQQELTHTLSAEKKKAEAELKRMQTEAAGLKARLNVLETQVANADRKLAEAREGWNEKMMKKEKEIGELQARLKLAMETKYSGRVLWEDFTAWTRGVGMMAKDKTQKGVAWAVTEGRKQGKAAQVALAPLVAAATEKARELQGKASNVCMPLVETHVLPPYRQHVHPLWEKVREAAIPVWRQKVQPGLAQGAAWAAKCARKGVAVAREESRKGRRATVVWVGRQEWSRGRDADRLVAGALYVLTATVLFLLRSLIRGFLVGLGELTVWLVRLPFVVIFWIFFWPFVVLGWGKKREGGEADAAAGGGLAGKEGGTERRKGRCKVVSVRREKEEEGRRDVGCGRRSHGPDK